MHPKKLLDIHNISPKKSLGQNFIYDKGILERIAEAAELSSSDSVLEIGSGLGSLTQQLAARAGKVVAVEIDDRLMPILNEQLSQYENVQLIQGDILKLNPDVFFDGHYKVVANKPYYITGAILRNFISAACRPSSMIITVQREVAQRMAAKPDNMSILSTTVQFYSTVSILFWIKAGAFWPSPDVDSAVVRLAVRENPLLKREEEENFLRLVKVGYSQKRKQLQKNLRSLGYPRPVIMASLDQAKVDGTRRAETLDVNEWLALFRALS